MNTIDAIYVGGKFEPLGTVSLSENQRVRLTIESSPISAPFSEEEILQRLESAKTIAEWVEATKLLPSDEGDYDIVRRLRENRIFSGEVVPPEEAP